MQQRDRRDDAQHAVVDDQEERDDDEARDARLQALIERLLAERGRDLRARDLVELQRQRADLEDLRQVLRGLDREAAGDLGAVLAVDAVRVLAPVDQRRRHELVVERDREVLRGRLGILAERVVDAALGDPARDRLERLAALVGEVEVDDRLVADRLVEALLRALDVRAGEAGAILDDPPAVGLRVVRLGALLAQDEDAGRDLDDLGVGALVRASSASSAASRESNV